MDQIILLQTHCVMRIYHIILITSILYKIFVLDGGVYCIVEFREGKHEIANEVVSNYRVDQRLVNSFVFTIIRARKILLSSFLTKHHKIH